MNNLQETILWHKRVLDDSPLSREEHANRQYHCILEEVEELKDAMVNGDNIDKLDALIDIIVTCVGTGVALGFDIEGAWQEINYSNFTKFEDEIYPLFDGTGKVEKGEGYQEPDLRGFV